jgi:IclR family acetate operon transcriptional repressor
MATRVEPSAGRSGDVRSVARAAALLACFADADEPLTLTELARRTGLTMSTAHRLLGTLCSEGLLCRERDGERFLPGPLLLRLSRSSLLADDLGEIESVLTRLATETGESVCFGVRRGNEVALLLAVQSSQALRVEIRLGARQGLLRSAAGRALLAFADLPPKRAIEPFELEPAPSAEALTTRDQVVTDIAAAAFRGFAILDGELGEGVRALAAPVRIAGVPVRAAIELRGPRSRMEGDRLLVLGRHLVEAATDLARLPVAAAL